MTQQLIDVGAAANDRTGDTWRDAFIKVNANETELFGEIAAIGLQFIGQESDFDVQDATTITLETSKVYVITASFSTTKRFICEAFASITAFNQFIILTYTGTGTMFTGVDVNFTILSIGINAPNGALLSFSDVAVLNSHVVLIRDSTFIAAQKLGTFTSLASFVFNDVAAIAMEDGLTIAGTGWNVWRADNLGMTSTSATFVGIDMGVASADVVSFQAMLFDAPAGAIAYKGAASSANITTGNLGKIVNSAFKSGVTPLSGLTVDDIRWFFNLNDEIPDTMPDAMVTLTSNATETVITTANVPVKAAGTFILVRDSQFTTDTTGRITYNGERDLVTPVDIGTTINSASGTNKDITVYLALNGTVIADSAFPNRVGVTDPSNTSVIWQLSMSTNDFLEIWVENNSDTINLVVSNATLRVR